MHANPLFYKYHLSQFYMFDALSCRSCVKTLDALYIYPCPDITLESYLSLGTG